MKFFNDKESHERNSTNVLHNEARLNTIERWKKKFKTYFQIFENKSGFPSPTSLS